MLNKRGGEAIGLGMQWILELIILVTILATIISFAAISGTESNKNEIIAKELCMFTNLAETNTQIKVGPDRNLIIEKKEDGFLVRKNLKDIGFFYPCYLTDQITITQIDKYYIIEK